MKAKAHNYSRYIITWHELFFYKLQFIDNKKGCYLGVQGVFKIIPKRKNKENTKKSEH